MQTEASVCKEGPIQSESQNMWLLSGRSEWGGQGNAWQLIFWLGTYIKNIIREVGRYVCTHVCTDNYRVLWREQGYIHTNCL